MPPRDTLIEHNKKIKHHTKFPSVGGVPRSGGVVREAKTVLPSRPQVRCPTLLLCRSGAYAPCAYPRICSNCASACFHILGFIAGHRRWRGNPVIIKSHAFACGHNLLDCFAALAMTNMMKYILPGPRGQKAPHKNIRFCGDPAPRGDKKYPYMIFLLPVFCVFCTMVIA